MDGPAVLPSRQRLSGQGAPTDKERAMSQISKTVGNRYRQELIPCFGHDERGAIVLRQKWSRGQL